MVPAGADLDRMIRRPHNPLIETADGLHNNKGLSDESWRHILSSMCPNFEKDKFRIGDTDIPGAHTAWRARLRRGYAAKMVKKTRETGRKCLSPTGQTG